MQTVVILHGWGHSATQWRGAFEGVKDLQIIIWDLPGFGAEPLPAGGSDWGVSEYAAWVREKIERERLQEVILLGHSFGGRIAAEIAGARPAWLVALILYCAPCLYRPSTSVAVKRRIAKLARTVGLGGRYRGNAALAEADRNGLGAIYRNVVNFDQTDVLRKIAVPTLLLWGQNDTDVPVRIATEMSKLIPGSRLALLPQLGHNAHIENPNLFYGAAKKFICELGVRR